MAAVWILNSGSVHKISLFELNHSGNVLGEWVEIIKNIYHGLYCRQPFDTSADESALERNPWAAAGTTALLYP